MIRLVLLIFLLPQISLFGQNNNIASLLKKNKISLELVSHIDFNETFSVSDGKVSDIFENILTNKRIKIDSDSRYFISIVYGWTYKRDIELVIDNYKGAILDRKNDDKVIALFESSKANDLEKSIEVLVSHLLSENNKIAPLDNQKFIDITDHFKKIQVFAWDTSRPDSHSPAGVYADHTHSKNGIMLSYRFNSEYKSGNINGNTPVLYDDILENYNKYVSSLSFKTHSLDFMYGLTDNITFLSVFNYHNKEMVISTKSDILNSSNGFGDIELQFLINFFKNKSLRAHANVGIKLPLGSTDKKFNNEFLPYAMQLGTGNLGAVIGFTMLYQSKNISAGLQPMINLYSTMNRGITDYDYYQYGSHFDFNYWLAYKISKTISISYRQKNIFKTKDKGQDERLNPIDVTLNNPYNSSYEIIKSGLGLNISIPKGTFRNFRFSVEYTLPLYQNLDGIQLDLKRNLLAAIQFSPGGHKHH
jgi:hypothetical protein